MQNRVEVNKDVEVYYCFLKKHARKTPFEGGLSMNRLLNLAIKEYVERHYSRDAVEAFAENYTIKKTKPRGRPRSISSQEKATA